MTISCLKIVYDEKIGDNLEIWQSSFSKNLFLKISNWLLLKLAPTFFLLNENFVEWLLCQNKVYVNKLSVKLNFC